jgi:hypothetical protein
MDLRFRTFESSLLGTTVGVGTLVPAPGTLVLGASGDAQ